MTDEAHTDDAAAGFGPLRPTLLRVAYHMLGSVSDAEDVVQEAFIRWMKTDRAGVREPAAFLRSTVTRLCLDVLKSARHQRETYAGPWLPDPVVEEDFDEDITLPLMLVLELLSPLRDAAKNASASSRPRSLSTGNRGLASRTCTRAREAS